MKFNNKILIFSAIVACLLPVFSSGFVWPVSADQLTTPSVHVSQSPLAVVATPQSSVTSVAISSSPAMAICATSITSLSENTAINLNLPADCFSLSLRRLINQQKVTVVQNNNESVSVKVTTSAFRFIPNHLVAALPDISVPALPLPQVSFLITAWLVGALLSGVFVKKLNSRLKAAFSLSQLAMLRC